MERLFVTDVVAEKINIRNEKDRKYTVLFFFFLFFFLVVVFVSSLPSFSSSIQIKSELEDFILARYDIQA